MSSKVTAELIIFSDGACSGNPGPGGWGSIVYSQPKQYVRELGGGRPATTNNQMEMTGVIRALHQIEKANGHVAVFTDSVYVIRGITQWIWGWKKNNWQTSEGKAVSNQDLWEELFELTQSEKRKNKISWHYVRGHMGIPGNERCDEISVAFSKGQHIDLYDGSKENYNVDLMQIPEDTSLPDFKSKEKSASSGKAYYLSLLGGTLAKHDTWADCERRVKGHSGAKFKKVQSKEEELQVLKSWGIKAQDN